MNRRSLVAFKPGWREQMLIKDNRAWYGVRTGKTAVSQYWIERAVFDI